jgi:hypothetical protein
METLIIITSIAAAISITIYFSIKPKNWCPHCKSKKIAATGERKYHEKPPLALWGSPASYYEIEYRCENCGQLSWKKQKAVIVN